MAEVALRTGRASSPEPARSTVDASEQDDVQAGRGRGPLARAGALLEGMALLAGLGWGGLHVHDAWAAGQTQPSVIAGVSIAGLDVGGTAQEDLDAVAVRAGQSASARPLTLQAGAESVDTTAAQLGATADVARAAATALEVARSGDPVVDLQAKLLAAKQGIDIPVSYSFDESAALAQLQALAPRVETPSLPTRLDFAGRKVVPAEPGTALLAYDSLSAVATGLASGAQRVELVVAQKPPVEDPLGAIAADLDISIVLGSFDTPYRTDESYKDRTHNLKVGSTAIDGFVLQPGETFSFNETVGARSAENGYRYGTGISGGQLVDVLGGGICQVSSTMFGAGFFGGLEVVSARPHSRPSSYVDMGLDSTVVWPSVDMKLRNPYDFPVVLHMTVSQGKVHAEVLGPRRPYQIAFERSLEEAVPYGTVWRDDSRLRSGTESMAQRGRRGFKLKRERKFLQAGEVVKTESWNLNYPPTTEIIRRGTSPSGEMPEDKKRPALREPAPSLKIVQ
ncbi:MAG: VanW family protein [Myxococcota bacterium]